MRPDEAIVEAAPWRWRTGRLNRRDDELDNGSSFGEDLPERTTVTSSASRGRSGRGGVAGPSQLAWLRVGIEEVEAEPLVRS